MHTANRIWLGLTVAMLLPSAAFAQRVGYDVAQRDDFPALQTFAFKESAKADDTTTRSTTTYDSPFVEARTRAAIAAQLERRGMREDAAHPDVYVTTRRSFETETTVYAYPDWGLGYGYGWGWSPYYTGWGPWYGGTSWYTDERIMGTLIVDLENASTGQLLWRGMAEKHVHERSSPDSRTKRVNKEVAKIFEKFPVLDAVATSGEYAPRPTGR